MEGGKFLDAVQVSIDMGKVAISAIQTILQITEEEYPIIFAEKQNKEKNGPRVK